MKVPVKGETTCTCCMGEKVLFFHSLNKASICIACDGKGKIPTLTYKEVSAEDQVTEQINEWYNRR